MKIKEKIIFEIVSKVKKLLDDAKIVIPDDFPLEISHHYGIEQFDKYGCTIINVINRAYCKKIIILLPGQMNPTHKHKVKEETFQVLSGNIILSVNGKTFHLKAGELYTIECEMQHSFYSESGCIVEEISTPHNNADSYYEDSKISNRSFMERKTLVKDWKT